MITPIQASINITKLFLGCYLIFVVAILIIASLFAAYYFPNWTPLEVFK